ncbi:MAG TPA: Tol-Pal system protein TolB, partial [Gammaproteobacteria bacterium]
MLRMLRTSARVGWIASAAALCGLATSVAHAQGFNVRITEGSEKAVPIAVVPFGWQGSGAPAFDVSGVVSADLASTGRFAPVPTRDMVSRPTQAQQVNFQDWRLLDASYLVIGTLAESAPDQFAATFQLFDVVRGESLTAFRLEAARADLRRVSHRIADMVFEKLTGFPGVFSTQIAYVSESRQPDGSKIFRLIVSDQDGENANKVAESSQPLLSPSWSPDARRIAYVSFEGGVSGVYVQTLRTGTRERVSARAGVNSSPSFSPDGRMLALTLSRDTGNLDVHTLDLSTQVLRQLTTDQAIDTEATWSADGRNIYFTSDRAGAPQIYRVGTEA